MSTTQLAIATELLDQAVRLYYEGGADFASLHLAGAAEELLGKHAERIGHDSAFASLRDAAVRLAGHLDDEGTVTQKSVADAMNHAKNFTKHISAEKISETTFDARTEAQDMIDRAVANFYVLANSCSLVATARVAKFNAELVGRNGL